MQAWKRKKNIGETPVIKPDNNSEYYNGSADEFKDLKTNTESINREMTMETIITSRYPLLKDLTQEYGERLNGTNAVMHGLMVEMLLLKQ